MLVIFIPKGIIFRSKDFFDILLEQQMKSQEWKEIDAEQIEKMKQSTCLLDGSMKFKCKNDGVIYGLKRCDEPKFFWEIYAVSKGDTIMVYPDCKMKIKKHSFCLKKLIDLFVQ